jgi:glycosyltransferase involved in cell wall biosynthesis
MKVRECLLAMPPKVAVIIPTYNRAHYLRAAVDSVLAQSYDDFELIVVDDGSTDHTASLLRASSDARLRLLQQAHGGISAALNGGLRAACGTYIARLDSDDVWLPDLLETLVAVLDARPDIGVAYGKGQAIDASGKPLPHFNGMPLRFPADSLRSMLYDDFTCNIATLARRSCFSRAGWYDESLCANEDWDMWLRVARYERFAFVDRVLAHYRWHADNLTGPRSPLFRTVLETRTAPLDKFFSRPDVPAAAAAMRAIAYENVHLFCGLRWLHARAPGRAAGAFRAALRVSEAPLRTTVRIGWFALTTQCLGRFACGRRLVLWLTARRRRWLRASG